MARKLIRFLLVATLGVSASAQARYVEMWNPPEARASAIPAKAKAVKRRHVSVQHARPSHPPAKVVATPKVRPSPHQGLTYDDIPRKLTPEGNVLRVSGAHSRAHLER